MILCTCAGLAVSLGGARAMAQEQPPPVVPPETKPQEVPPPEIKPPETKPADEKAQDTKTPDAKPPAAALDPDAPFKFDFHTEVPLTTLINYVRDQLNIQVVFADSGLQNQSVVLTAPVTVPTGRVLEFLSSLLETKGYTIVRNDMGHYIVRPVAGLASTGVSGSDPFSSTQVIPAPGMKPSALQGAISGLGGTGTAVVALDDLGVLLVTDTPQRTKQIRELVERLVRERASIKIQKLEIKYIAANTARDRVLALLGESTGGATTTPPPQPGGGGKAPGGVGQPQGAGFSSGSGLWQARLLVDAQSNSLFFQGREDESKYIRELLDLVDVPNGLTSTFYAVGNRASEAVASAGLRLGLGDVTRYQSSDTGTSSRPGQGGAQGQVQQVLQGQQQLQQQVQSGVAPGSGFVIYPDAGGFMYHGTSAQHIEVAALVHDLERLTLNETVTYEFYKLKHAKAADVAEIVQNLLQGQLPSGNQGALLGGLSRNNQPGGSSRNPRDRNNPRTRNPQDQSQTRSPADTSHGATGTPNQGTGSGLNEIDAADSLVLADEKNNQIVVKTVGRLQPEFEKLIRKLDLRRPQVYVSAKIVAITATDEFRLAFETQLINANGTGGVVNTNFGLRGGSATSSILTPLLVGTGLPALTAAVIKSDQVPIVITALAQQTNTRVLATPQLLIDDNTEDATVSSENVQPTAVVSQGTSTTLTSAGDSARAGTTLTVTPQISEESVKLTYSVTQSSFTGVAANGLPPPSFENNISSEVTVPPQSTIVVGGLTLESDTDTVVKVPLLGDIPIVGALFRDTHTTGQKTTLYVFITPTIMRDPNFADLRLLTKGPMEEANIHPEDNLPRAEPVKMELLESPDLAHKAG